MLQIRQPQPSYHPPKYIWKMLVPKAQKHANINEGLFSCQLKCFLNERKMGNYQKVFYILPCLSDEVYYVVHEISLNINLFFLSWALHKVDYRSQGCLKQITIFQSIQTKWLVFTFTTDAPLANFFPNFFEASPSLMPTEQMVN